MSLTSYKNDLPGRDSSGRFPKAKAKRVLRVPNSMNKTEQAYALLLLEQKQSGRVLDYRFEALKLRLADNTFYTPDFVVVMPDSTLELTEVKASWDNKTAHFEDDARVKIKVAAEQYPMFQFVTVYPVKDSIGRRVWQREEF